MANQEKKVIGGAKNRLDAQPRVCKSLFSSEDLQLMVISGNLVPKPHYSFLTKNVINI